MRDIEEVSDIAAHVSRFAFRRKSSGWLSVSKRLCMAYCILAQLSVVVPKSGYLTLLSDYLVPLQISVVLGDLSRTNPKLFSFALMLLCLLLYRCYPVPAHEESLLVMRSLGVQTTSGGTSRFIPKNEVGSTG